MTAIVREWVNYLREVLLFGIDDPVFPKTATRRGDATVFESAGLTREHWSNATPIRNVFKSAFERAGLQYFNPHSIRNTLVHLGEKTCRGPEEFKAWSQNIGHEDVMTTFSSYGEVQPTRQAEIFKTLACSSSSQNDYELEEAAKDLLRRVRAKERA